MLLKILKAQLFGPSSTAEMPPTGKFMENTIHHTAEYYANTGRVPFYTSGGLGWHHNKGVSGVIYVGNAGSNINSLSNLKFYNNTI